MDEVGLYKANVNTYAMNVWRARIESWTGSECNVEEGKGRVTKSCLHGPKSKHQETYMHLSGAKLFDRSAAAASLGQRSLFSFRQHYQGATDGKNLQLFSCQHSSSNLL